MGLAEILTSVPAFSWSAKDCASDFLSPLKNFLQTMPSVSSVTQKDTPTVPFLNSRRLTPFLSPLPTSPTMTTCPLSSVMFLIFVIVSGIFSLVLPFEVDFFPREDFFSAGTNSSPVMILFVISTVAKYFWCKNSSAAVKIFLSKSFRVCNVICQEFISGVTITSRKEQLSKFKFISLNSPKNFFSSLIVSLYLFKASPPVLVFSKKWLAISFYFS